MENQIEKATLAAGCFWCIEAIFQRVKGVTNVQSGYSGGHTLNPKYQDVCKDITGHAEVCVIDFDSNIISFSEILNIFWHIHNPTTLNRQGNNIGSQYRSAIFFHNENQKNIAQLSKHKCEQSNLYHKPIVTEITAWKNFHPAEDIHNSYFELHQNEPYCRLITLPKLEKFKKEFSHKLKKAED